MAIDAIGSLSSVKPIAAQTVKQVGGTESNGKTFGEIFSNALGDVNKLQLDAGKASADLAAGKVQDVSDAVIAAEKASISLQLTMAVRNKVIDAYQEIMRMQV